MKTMTIMAALLGCALVAHALEPVVDDYWDTTGYVNVGPTSVASAALVSALATPCAGFLPEAYRPTGEEFFDSWWMTANVSPALGSFSSVGPGFLLFIR